MEQPLKNWLKKNKKIQVNVTVDIYICSQLFGFIFKFIVKILFISLIFNLNEKNTN